MLCQYNLSSLASKRKKYTNNNIHKNKLKKQQGERSLRQESRIGFISFDFLFSKYILPFLRYNSTIDPRICFFKIEWDYCFGFKQQFSRNIFNHFSKLLLQNNFCFYLVNTLFLCF